MGQELANRVNELLNEEKWTRATLKNYTVSNFKELDELLEQITQQGAEDDILDLCNEHLQHTKNSLIALYLSGLIRLSRQTVDDGNLVQLIEIFKDNHKWNIVSYLCDRILSFGENRYALRTLAEAYNNENQLDKMYETWERLIRVDYDEADIVKLLAERKESQGALDDAILYYKKALHRYIAKKSFSNIKEIWHKLVKHSPEETEFFFHAERKIAKQVSEDRAVQLLEDLYPYFKDAEKWETAITILKRVLTYDPRNPWARKEIVECYRELYANHSHLEEYIKLSNLNQGWRNVHDAIADFEKHISFDAGNFVYHRSWGVGLIRKIDDDDEITIDFVKKRGHSMSLKMAVSALTVLSKDHIWVLKTTRKKEKLKQDVKKNPAWALKVVIRSLNNAADMKQIKAELVPSVLTQSEWSSWSTRARELLKTDEQFGNVPDRTDVYAVREQPISLEEKIYNRFKAERNFFDRAKTIEEFLHYSGEGDSVAETDYFREMLDYFVGFLRQTGETNEYTLSSYLIVERIVREYPYLDPGIEMDFKSLFDSLPEPEKTFALIGNNDLKKRCLTHIRKKIPEWPDLYVRLFPYFLSKEIITELRNAEKDTHLTELYRTVVDRYRDQRAAFVWLARNVENDNWFERVGLTYEKVLINLIHIAELTFRDIENRRDVSENRKINRQVQTYLFKEKRLEQFFDVADEDSIQRIFALIEDIEDLDEQITLNLKNRILSRFPDFRSYGDHGRESINRGGFIVTPSSYEQKQKALEQIHNVEVPKNSKEIAAAREYGDLKENAEYKAAKERQDQLNSEAARLEEGLRKASMIRPREVDTSVISFGTTVDLYDKERGETVTYTILGPWESDPDKRIISYQSPLGHELYNHKVGEELDFVINDRKYSLRVDDIRRAEFE